MTNRTFMTVEEVAAELGVSKSYAYKIVKQLNEELQKLIIHGIVVIFLDYSDLCHFCASLFVIVGLLFVQGKL